MQSDTISPVSFRVACSLKYIVCKGDRRVEKLLYSLCPLFSYTCVYAVQTVGLHTLKFHKHPAPNGASPGVESLLMLENGRS